MMGLERRVLFLTVGGLVGVILLGFLMVMVRSNIQDSAQTRDELAEIHLLWDSSVLQEADHIRELAFQMFPADDSSALGPNGVTRLSRQRFHSFTIYDEFGQPKFIWPGIGQTSAVDSLWIAQLVHGHSGFQEIDLDGSEALLLVGGAFNPVSSDRTAFVASVAIKDILADVAGSVGGSVFLLDPSRRVLASSGALSWNFAMSSALASRPADLFETALDSSAIQIAVLPLRAAGKGLIGNIVVARDITRHSQLLDVVDGVSIGLAVLIGLVLVLTNQWLVNRTFNPLGTSITAVSALAEGDTSVEVLGGDRPGELGLMARSIQRLRDRVRNLRDTEQQRLRQWSRQQEFIRVQMMQLADTLPEEGRNAFLNDLQRIEAATGATDARASNSRSLAVVFEVMASRIVDQYRRLEDLVRELQAALATKTELFQLQQQVEIARRMQETMLPSAIAPPPGIEIAGFLLPAEGFDGGFYDYVVLEDGTLAIAMGEPAVSGIASGFVSATAHTSLRVLLLAGLSPGECLTRTAALLARETAADRYAIAALVLDPKKRTLTWAAAGIQPPFLIRKLGDAVALPLEVIPPLDGSGTRHYDDQRFDLPQRATLVLASPGMHQNVNAFGGIAGSESLVEILRDADDLSATGMIEALRKGALIHTGGKAGVKDRLCVAARLTE